jgi:serine/threonine protein kinase
MSALKADTQTKRRDIQLWFDEFKKHGILQNLKSYYEIGNLLGKGNFAKVYEVTNFQTGNKYAIKTIDKSIMAKSKKSFVSFS